MVSKNLGADTLQRWLTEQGYATDRIATSKGFRVLVRERRCPESRQPAFSEIALSASGQRRSRIRPPWVIPIRSTTKPVTSPTGSAR